jgi:hypothetical protein
MKNLKQILKQFTEKVRDLITQKKWEKLKQYVKEFWNQYKDDLTLLSKFALFFLTIYLATVYIDPIRP